MPAIRIKRGTRAEIDAAAAANGLAAGEPYLITDEQRLAIGLSAASYQAQAKQGEGGGDGWTRLTADADFRTASSNPRPVPGLGFVPGPNRIYEIEGRILCRAESLNVAVRVGWRWPTGNLADGAMLMEMADGPFMTARAHVVAGMDGGPEGNGQPYGAAVSQLCIIRGILVTNGGTAVSAAQLTLHSRFDNNGTTVRRAGSFLAYREI